MGPSLVKLNDKIQSNLDKIPPGVSQPLIRPKGVDDVPVVTLTLWSEDVDDGSIRILALDLLQRLGSRIQWKFLVHGFPCRYDEFIDDQRLMAQIAGFQVIDPGR